MTGRTGEGMKQSSLQSRERVIIREIMAMKGIMAQAEAMMKEVLRKEVLMKEVPEEAALRAVPAITEKAVETAPEKAMREKAAAMRAGSLLTRISRRSQPRTG